MPGFWNVDLALSKNIALKDDVRLQVHGDLFNAFNVTVFRRSIRPSPVPTSVALPGPGRSRRAADRPVDMVDAETATAFRHDIFRFAGGRPDQARVYRRRPGGAPAGSRQPVVGWDINPSAWLSCASRAGEIGGNAGEVFSRCRRVLLSLPSHREVADVIRPAGPALGRGLTIIDTTTGDPTSTEELARVLGDRGITYLTRPFPAAARRSEPVL